MENTTALPLPGKERGKIKITSELGFVTVHLLPLLAIFTGATTFDWILMASLYFLRMFFVTGFYHRYFSHKSFKTSRIFQFIMAFLAQTSAQKGALWWAANHRIHHKYSDKPEDPHSMKLYGFLYSHVGWIIGPDYKATRWERIPEMKPEKYPELAWLNKYYLVPPVTLGFFVAFLGSVVNGGHTGWDIIPGMFSKDGMSALLIGFFLSTVLLYHGTFTINSIMHKFGKPRYETNDASKNSLWLALLTLGEGWHNNHHYYQASTRQGFFWWEIDITYYLLKLLSFTGLIWDIKEVPPHILASRNKEDARKLAAQAGKANDKELEELAA